jgi:hypothetical protein
LPWTSLNSGSHHQRFEAEPHGVFFASWFGGIFRSVDYGRTWTSLTVSGEHPNDFTALRVLSGHPEWLFALSRNRGVYVMELPQE